MGVDGTRLTGTAPAKINLALHLVGRRADGYHLVDTLVAFADFGDRLSIEPSDRLSLAVSGPQSDGVPADNRNLVLKAALRLAEFGGGRDVGAAISLEKNLPFAAGIGGGSANAALALKMLAGHWRIDADLAAIAMELGADVPMCLFARPARATGAGEVLSPVPRLPPLYVVLANPGEKVPTGAAFGACKAVHNAPLPKPEWRCLSDFVSYLRATRNDMTEAACAFAPGILPLLDVMQADPTCLFARMSGSGATCFGLFETERAATACENRLESGGFARWVCSGALATA